MFLDMDAPPPQKGSSGGLLFMIFAVGWLGAIIFYASMFFVTCRYAAWLSGVARRHPAQTPPTANPSATTNADDRGIV